MRRLPRKYFYVIIKMYLLHQGSVFIVLWCNFLLNSTRGNLMMQMMRYAGGNHMKSFLALLSSPSVFCQRERGYGVLLKGGVSSCLLCPSRLSETGGAWSD